MSPFATDGKDGQGLKLETVGPTFQVLMPGDIAPLTSQRVKFEIWLVNLVGKHILQPGSRNLESWSFVGVKEKKKKHCFITELRIYFKDVSYLQVTTFFRTNI